MKVIYTNSVDTAFLIAKAIGSGITVTNKAYKKSELDANERAIKVKGQDDGYFKTVYEGAETLLTWGAGIKIDMQYTENKAEYFPTEIKYKEIEGCEDEAKRLVKIFSDDINSEIYDASEGHAQRFQFVWLLCYSKALEQRKTIRRVEIEKYDNDGIAKAFKEAFTTDLTARFIERALTHQLIYWTANDKLSVICPDQHPYPKFKDLPLLDDIVTRCDNRAAEEAKKKYTVELQVSDPETGVIMYLKSKQACFRNEAERDAFCKKIAAEQTLKIEQKEKYEACKGPHSRQSLIETVRKEHNYTEQTIINSITMLESAGYIKNAGSKERLLPEGEISNFRAQLRMLSRKTKLIPDRITEQLNSVKIEPSRITKEKKCGILLSADKPISGNMSAVEKEVYLTIAKELVKMVAGKKKTVTKLASITIDNIVFTASTVNLIFRGYAEFEKLEDYRKEVPEEFTDGMNVIVEPRFDSTIQSIPPLPTELEIKTLYTSNNSSIVYTADEIDGAIKDLVNRGYLTNNAGTLSATNKAMEVIHYLRNFENLIGAPLVWENDLNKISDPQETTDEEAKQLSKSLSNQVVSSLKAWIAKQSDVSGLPTDINCPICGKPMRSSPQGLSCNSCGYKVDRTIQGKKHDNVELKYLFLHGATKLVPGYIKGDRNVYGRLFLDGNKQICFTMDSTAECPACKKKLRVNDGGYYCPNCNFKVKWDYLGYHLKAGELVQLIQKGMTPLLIGLKSQGRTFNGALYIDNDDFKVKCIEVSDED